MPVRGIPKIARGLKPRNSLSKLSHQRDGGSSWRKCPELLVKQTRRMSRIFAVALLFASVRLVDYLLGGRSIDTIVQYSHSSSSSSSILEDNYSIQKPAQEKIQIFYNLFTKGVDDEEHVKKIVEEQFSLLDPRYHNTNVSIISIGHALPLAGAILGNATYHIQQHHESGGEELTLHALWQYCKSNSHNNKDTKVVYLHSKGSFHPTGFNTKLRQFLTHGALSSECANLPEKCNVCSSRFSPLPHPHTSGNMWLARCDYISRLFNPLAATTNNLQGGDLPGIIQQDDPCKGTGRYLSEHWVHSHPSVKPCDLYTGKEYTWGYFRVPRMSQFTNNRDVQNAPRFEFEIYEQAGFCKNEHPETMSKDDFVRLRKENYDLLYNITKLDEDWWGWIFFKSASASF